MERLLLEFSVRVALIAAVTGIMLRVLRIRRAAVQHGAWVCVTLAMLALPAWMVWGPKASLPLLPSDPIVVTKAAPAIATFTEEQSPIAATIETAPVRSARAAGWNRDRIVAGAYLFVAGIFLLRLAIGTIRARRLNSASCSVPVTVGLLRPRVILPESSREWSGEQLDVVLAHEQAHVRRRDPLFQWMALLNRAVFWFHPLSWWLVGSLSALAEEACDAAALEGGHDPREYSMCLLEMAREAKRAGARINAVAMAMPGSHLPQRIKKIAAGMVAPRVPRARLVFAAIVCAVPAILFAAGSLEHAPRVLLLPPVPVKAPEPPMMLAQTAAPVKAEPAPPQTDNVKFEVASVRALPPVPPNTSVASRVTGGPGTQDPEHIRYTQVAIFQILTRAFGIQGDQLIGPEWVTQPFGAERFEIIANVPAGATQPQLNVMMQNLLKDRFHLAYHIEKRNLEAYEIVVAKGGSKLQSAVIPTEMPVPEFGKPAQAYKGDDGYPNLPPGWPSGVGLVEGSDMKLFFIVRNGGGFRPAAANSVFSAGGRLEIWRVAMRMVTVPDFMDVLQTLQGIAHIVDRTGLNGQYDIKLRFSNGGTEADGQPSEPAPDLFGAIEEQLGLKIQKIKTPLDVVVIDHIDRTPVEN